MVKIIKNLQTPCYIVDADKFKANVRLFDNHFSSYGNVKKILLGYSVKTNHNPEIMKLALTCGMAAEVVSDDEYHLALKCGYPEDKIIFNGPQKSEEMLLWALKNGSIVNLDNFEEIGMLEKHSQELDLASLKIGIRVNFDLEKRCSGETTAGKEVSRFGFCVENGDFEKAVNELKTLGISVNGVHMHYSSKSRSINIYKELAAMAGHLVRKYLSDNDNVFIDIGGGFFLGKEEKTPGKPTVEEYAKVIVDELKKSVSIDKVDLIIEPGASLLATPISYLTKVINTRFVREVKILTLDGSILHVNPFMANREPIAECIYSDKRERKIKEQIFCGATCMENDRFLKMRDAKEVQTGDYLACSCVGAYTMGFNSCFINLPPYIYIRENDEYRMIRNKDTMLMEII